MTKVAGIHGAKRGTNPLNYPWKLTATDIKKILSVAPDEVDLVENSRKNLKEKDSFTARTFLDLFVKSKTVYKVGMRRYEVDNPRVGNKTAYHKFRYLVTVLLKHPGLITQDMEEEIKRSSFLQGFLVNKTYHSLKLPESGEEVQVLSEDIPMSPVANQQEVKLRLLGNVMDKIELVVSNITAGKVQKAGLGTLSKSLSDLTKAYTVMKDGVTMQSFNQYNIKNLNLVQKKELSQKIGANE